MLENSLSCAVLHIAATINSTVTVSYNGIIIYELHNGYGWTNIIDSDTVEYLCNITQFGTYIIQSNFNGFTKTETITIDNIRSYYVSMCIYVIFQSGHPEYSKYQPLYIENNVRQQITNDYIKVWYTTTDSQCGMHLKSYPKLINPNLSHKTFSKFVLDIEITNWFSGNYYARMIVAPDITACPAVNADGYVARLALSSTTPHKEISLDISNVSGTYVFGVVGVVNMTIYNMYLI